MSSHPMPDPTPTFSAEAYFASQPAPPLLAQDLAGVQEFVARQAAQNRNVVLVTSGGTTVPLELNVVRFLDNFSAGTRGATSAEYFLKAGYAVIFMHRQFSLQPFSRHYSHSTNPFLDFLALEGEGDAGKGTVGITPAKRADADLLAVLTAYKRVQAAGTLHTLTFVTVDDYLWLLRAVSQTLSALRRRAMYYLAAAVSDFFLPRQKMSEHKIQSGKGSLHIEMDQVPKVLKPMVEEWTRDGYIVSFKLETDARLLIPKARAALERYGHQVVIGNELHTRKVQVVFVERKRKPLPPLPPGAQLTSEPETAETEATQAETETEKDMTFVESWLRIAPPPSPLPGAAAQLPAKEIEEDIVAELVRRHEAWIAGA
ncbi:DNA/pantothenate metabolism flavoprotein [Mycena latifolia]|nr:DNA/pantothenate metabolism flavoprotein [Mycena latifolia]